MRSDNKPRGQTFVETARRAQILEGAAQVIAESGYPRASLARIAEHIGVAKGVVLYHFKSKDALVAALVTDVMTAAAATIAPAVLAERTAAGRLRAYIGANIAVLDANRIRSIALFEIAGSYRTEDGRRFDEAAADAAATEPPSGDLRFLDPYAIFEQGIADGEFRPFSSLFMKNALRAALDGAVSELARNAEYDVVGYGDELITIFELATRRAP